MMHDLILTEATALQRHWPTLTPQDWRVLASIIDAAPTGLAYTAIRADTEWYGTSRKHLASLDRLIAAGLISKQQSGGSTAPVTFKRTAVPLVPRPPVFQPTITI